jgi:predicted HTH domain antitoxin
MKDIKSMQDLENKIKEAVDIYCNSKQEEIIKLAVQDFEVELRRNLALITLNLSEVYSVERTGYNLLITVHIKKDEIK